MRDTLVILLPLIVGTLLGWLIRFVYARLELASSEQKAHRILSEATREIEAKKREAILETKDELLRERNDLEKEARVRRKELQRAEQRLLQREENLDAKLETVDNKEKQFIVREATLNDRTDDVDQLKKEWVEKIQQLAGLTEEQAKSVLITRIEENARLDAQSLVYNIEAEAKKTAEDSARKVVISAMQRLASETTSELSIASVNLPSEEMKGRIIGREGRNVRTLENLTGVDIIIDDTPEAGVISCFDPLRRETARTSLERLITDGRIHPARIEEIVRKVSREIDKTIEEDAQRVLFDLEIANMHQDLIKTLGRLKYRTSYGLNQ